MSEFGDLLGYEDHQGDVMSDLAQINYEEGLIQECRDWVDGKRTKPLKTDHVRVLLAWAENQQPSSHPQEGF